MIQEVDRLNRVVGQLLEFARPISIKPQSISLQAMIANSLKLIEDRAAEKKISVKIQNNARHDEARIDPDRINQILLNLYLNAIDAMPTGGELRITCRPIPTSLFTVAVSGADTAEPGIAQRNLSRIQQLRHSGARV